MLRVLLGTRFGNQFRLVMPSSTYYKSRFQMRCNGWFTDSEMLCSLLWDLKRRCICEMKRCLLKPTITGFAPRFFFAKTTNDNIFDYTLTTLCHGTSTISVDIHGISMDMPRIFHVYVSGLHIYGIYHVYTWYIIQVMARAGWHFLDAETVRVNSIASPAWLCRACRIAESVRTYI